jgi:hypothetical protein
MRTGDDAGIRISTNRTNLSASILRLGWRTDNKAGHAKCARRAKTSHFSMVNADNWILDEFAFELEFQPHDNEVAV